MFRLALTRSLPGTKPWAERCQRGRRRWKAGDGGLQLHAEEIAVTESGPLRAEEEVLDDTESQRHSCRLGRPHGDNGSGAPPSPGNSRFRPQVRTAMYVLPRGLAQAE